MSCPGLRRWHWCLSLVFPHSENLTWRDMQHLVVQTSKPAHLNANDWVTNGVGRKGTGMLGLDQGLQFLQAPSAWVCWGRAAQQPWGPRPLLSALVAALTPLCPQSATPMATGCWMLVPW